MVDRRFRTLGAVAGVAAICAVGLAGAGTAGAAEQPPAPADPPDAPGALGPVLDPHAGQHTPRRVQVPDAAADAFIYRPTPHGRGVFKRVPAIRGAGVVLHQATNNDGQVVGSYVDAGVVPGPDGAYPDGAIHGFVQDRRGRVTRFDVPGGGGVLADGINNRGQTTGIYLDPGTVAGPDGFYPPRSVHGFVRDRRGAVTTFDVPFPRLHAVYDINNRGQVVFSVDNPDRPYGLGGGFLREPNGQITEIRVPGALNTTPRAINDRGQIAGVYYDADARLNPDGTVPPGVIHGFIWDRGHIRTFDVPGSLQTVAFGMNNRGQVSGGYTTAEGHQRGFLLDGRHFTTIDAPGGADNIALDINDRQEIVIPDPRTTSLLPIGT
jgi:uncharacterized membrane protein